MDEETICKVPSIIEIMNANFNICEDIVNAYYRLTPQPPADNIIPNYVGKNHHYYNPYSIVVHGAYPIRPQWELLEARMNDPLYFPAYKQDIIWESLTDFARGFQYGFDHFIADKIADPFLLDASPKNKVQAIWDYLSDPSSGFAFSEAHGGGRNLFSLWYEDGIKGGYQYCAWVYIMKNHKEFEPYFKGNAIYSGETAKRPISKENNEDENNSATLGQKVLFMHYLFEQLGLKELEATKKAKINQFLTGSELGAKALKNTNVYKKTLNPLAINETTSTRDLQVIRSLFELLGLNEILQKINKEIGNGL